jgi:hypothetical protein
VSSAQYRSLSNRDADSRLSEANMDSIIGGIEEVYRDNSRNGMSTHGS